MVLVTTLGVMENSHSAVAVIHPDPNALQEEQTKDSTHHQKFNDGTALQTRVYHPRHLEQERKVSRNLAHNERASVLRSSSLKSLSLTPREFLLSPSPLSSAPAHTSPTRKVTELKMQPVRSEFHPGVGDYYQCQNGCLEDKSRLDTLLGQNDTSQCNDITPNYQNSSLDSRVQKNHRLDALLRQYDLQHCSDMASRYKKLSLDSRVQRRTTEAPLRQDNIFSSNGNTSRHQNSSHCSRFYFQNFDNSHKIDRYYTMNSPEPNQYHHLSSPTSAALRNCKSPGKCWQHNIRAGDIRRCESFQENDLSTAVKRVGLVYSESALEAPMKDFNDRSPVKARTRLNNVDNAVKLDSGTSVEDRFIMVDCLDHIYNGVTNSSVWDNHGNYTRTLPISNHVGCSPRLSSHSSKHISRSSSSQSLQSLNPDTSTVTTGNLNTPHQINISSVTTTYKADTIPRGRDTTTPLRRTVSFEPKNHNSKPVVVKSSSHRQIDSEYVSLDNRYVYEKCSRLPEVYEEVVQHTHTNVTISQQPLVNGYVDYIRNNFDSETSNNCPGTVLDATKPIKNSSMTNLVSRKQTPRKKGGSGTLHVMAETFGSLFSSRSSTSTSGSLDSPISEESASGLSSITRPALDTGHPGANFRSISRSNSLPDLQADVGLDKSNNYSDDEDGDDFGFLSYPISFMSSCTSAAMNKVKAPSPGGRMIQKRWRSKTNAVPSAVSMWTPGPLGSCTWSSVSGRKVQLRPVNILSLSEAERVVLRKLAMSKLQAMVLGCPMSIPNETDEQQKTKKSPLSLKRRSKSASASALDTMAKDGTPHGLAFGIPLLKCIVNDREMEKRRQIMAAASPIEPPSSPDAKSDSSDNLLILRAGRKSSSSSQGSGDHNSSLLSRQLESLTVPSHKRAASCDSLSESESSRNTSSSLIDALSLSTSNPTSRPSSLAIDGSQLANLGEAQVPYVVKTCFKHIETYGLQTLGIFRVGCSKKRVKQLREEFDSGKEVKLSDEHNPHDVGALLKEYFRDLPEPLLTRELYLPFLHAEKIKDEHKRHTAISLLIFMLPVANRDTLWALLRFLAVVSQHALDITDDRGGTISGNKMDSHNLATLFGPNILHRTKSSSDKELLSESAERVVQSKEVIEVVKDMIDNHHELFEIPASLRDEVLRILVESNPETTDKILKQLASQNQIEADPESMCSVFEESTISTTLPHSVNSDADLLAYTRKQAAASHRLLRITKSADDSLEYSPSETYNVDIIESVVTTDKGKASLPRPEPPVKFHLDSDQCCSSSASSGTPIFQITHDSEKTDVVLRNRLEPGHVDRPHSEGFIENLHIPQPLYARENSYTSLNVSLSPSFNSQYGFSRCHSGHVIFPTQPMSQNPSPNQLIRSASSSSALLALPAASQLNHSYGNIDVYTNSAPIGSAQWERERWKYWEKIARQKKTAEVEQETLV